ncbi:MAG: hypothetical protein RL755_82 [Pseudomonadota bacterium]
MFNFTCHRAVFLASSLSLICFSEATLAVPKVKKIQPHKIASTFALATLLKKHNTNRFGRMYVAYADTGATALAGSAAAKSTSVSHTDTNVQVTGVDESDRAKVDDNGYIYQLVNNQVIIAKAFPAAQLGQSAVIELPQDNFSPMGLYLQNGKLVVVGNTWQTLSPPVEFENTPLSPTAKMAYGGWWGYMRNNQTRTLIYDVSDQTQPKQIRDVVVDGDYLDSRRVGNYLYFMTRSYPRYYMAPNMVSTNPWFMKSKDILPSVTDNKAGKTTTKTLAIKDVVYFPNFVEPDYVVVASIDLEQPQKEVVTKAYLGAGDLVYASHENLYLSASKYNFGGNGDVVPQNITTTQIFKIGIDAGQMNFTAAGEVNGTALNQFSMDEQGDYFRIATTTRSWFSGTSESYSSLFVLNKDMKTVGKIDKLGEGENIYATRFMGNRCYIVTFKLTDPLFAIDLSTPENPVVMGELKIPGYSNYLHPIDETHLIGFGKEAAIYQPEKLNTDTPNTDTPWWTDGSAFYQGLKVALFDVADMKNPKQIDSVTIGERGTDSPILWDHKALYWDAEKHLFGFPVQESHLRQAFDPQKPWNYGQPTYQGAYIYEVTPEKGFTFKARLSQIPDSMTPKTETYDGYSYSYWESEASNYFIDRILRVDDSLYTLSSNQITAYSLENYKETNRLVFKPQVNSQK